MEVDTAFLAVDHVCRDPQPLVVIQHVELVLAKPMCVWTIEAVQRTAELFLELGEARFITA